MNGEIQCPKCGSIQLTAKKKGYSLTKGLTGMVLTGGFGLLGGLFGSNNIQITCLACGHKFKPGDGRIVSVTNEISSIDEFQVSEFSNDENLNDIILKEAKKEALEAEFNEDYNTASLLWCDYIRQLHDLGLELDEKAFKSAINNCELAENPFRSFCLYEDMISWYPTHINVDQWIAFKNKVEPQIKKPK